MITLFTMNANSYAHTNYVESLPETEKSQQEIINEQIDILAQDEGIQRLSLELLVDSKTIAQNLIKTWNTAEKFISDVFYIAESDDEENMARISKAAREDLLEVLIVIPESTVRYFFNSYLEQRTSKSYDVYTMIMHPEREE